jgi:hypothetical protein
MPLKAIRKSRETDATLQTHLNVAHHLLSLVTGDGTND